MIRLLLIGCWWLVGCNPITDNQSATLNLQELTNAYNRKLSDHLRYVLLVPMGNCGHCKDVAVSFAKRNLNHSELLVIASNRGKKGIEMDFGNIDQLPNIILADYRSVADSLRVGNGYVRLFTLSGGKVESVIDLPPDQIEAKLQAVQKDLIIIP